MTRPEFEWAIQDLRKALKDAEPNSSYWWYIKGGLTTLQIYYKSRYKTAKKSYLTELLSES